MCLFLLAVPTPVEGEEVKVMVQLEEDVGVTFMFPVQYEVLRD